MQFKKLVLCIFVSLASFGLKAQETQVFPIKGTFAIQGQSEVESRQFNRIVVNEKTYVLQLNDKAVKFFKLAGVSEKGYEVEQYFPDMEVQPAERLRFFLKLDEFGGRDYHVSLLYHGSIDKLHLIKID